ncbi:predicted protein [Micromonas commoda]|uniref:Peptidase S74 domain-containing protein n=1 Tax=Micromonas commoda (strain RCC299 / NOUM17 / CCMP2709) TaxID=296587 RepID=C1E156_MICCC|nr:predicted protein [Micromonas commoda]ACO61680.1 predicted protein [Micromonas commoda]|eukprot:XP_002500422.1 predicted protein [Micromonas commoda]
MAVTSTFGVTSDFTVNTDKFIVNATNGNTKMTGNLEMSGDTATLTHSGSTGGLAISSAQHVDVESVRFTTNQIGSTGDPDLITLTDNKVSISGQTLEMSGSTSRLQHTGTTSLAISSTNGHITIAGGSGDYVDVESVRFTDDYIGISGDTDIIRLTSTGSQATVAMVADVDVTGTMDVSSDFAVNTNSFKVTGTNGNTEILGSLTMKAVSGIITHDGASGSLAISSSTGPVTIAGQSTGGYVDVESVRFTDNQIGINGDADIITLTSLSGTSTVAFANKITTGDLATLNSATVTTTLHSGGDLTVGTGPKLTVAASSGDVVTAGKIAVAGSHGDATKALYVTGSVYATGAVTSASDSRFKRDVRSIHDPLAIVRSLEPVTFTFKRDAFPTRDFPVETQAGFLAQDLERVLPHLVTEDDEGYKGVAYERLGVYAVAGVKALDESMERLDESMERLDESMERLQNDTVARLEARVVELERALAALVSRASGPTPAGR